MKTYRVRGIGNVGGRKRGWILGRGVRLSQQTTIIRGSGTESLCKVDYNVETAYKYISGGIASSNMKTQSEIVMNEENKGAKGKKKNMTGFMETFRQKIIKKGVL